MLSGRPARARATSLTTIALGFALLLAGTNVAMAQNMTIDFGDGSGSLATRSIQLIVLITLLGLVPGLAVMLTCFPFIVTVLAILRQALGLQQSPPNMLIISLSLFLTWFVMEPVFTQAWQAGGAPFAAGEMRLEPAFTAAIEPFRGFMAARVDPATFESLAALRDSDAVADPSAPLSLLVPSFLLSEVAPGVPDRLSRLPAVPHHRPCRRRDPHVDGDDDGPTRDRVAAVQAGLLRRCRWLEPGFLGTGAQLLLRHHGQGSRGAPTGAP